MPPPYLPPNTPIPMKRLQVREKLIKQDIHITLGSCGIANIVYEG